MMKVLLRKLFLLPLFRLMWLSWPRKSAFSHKLRRAGGSFYFEAKEQSRLKNLFFVAGGIGINPIFSMLQEALRCREELEDLERITLLYSAKSEEELAYRQ